MKSAHTLIKAAVCILIAIAVTSCTKDDPTAPIPLPAPPSTAGVWSGTLAQGSVFGPILLTLSQEGTMIRGTGTVGGLNASITGQNHYPNITFVCSSPGYVPFSFAGKFTSSTRLTGIANGSGFTDATVNLTKNQ